MLESFWYQETQKRKKEKKKIKKRLDCGNVCDFIKEKHVLCFHDVKVKLDSYHVFKWVLLQLMVRSSVITLIEFDKMEAQLSHMKYYTEISRLELDLTNNCGNFYCAVHFKESRMIRVCIDLQSSPLASIENICLDKTWNIFQINTVQILYYFRSLCDCRGAIITQSTIHSVRPPSFLLEGG